MLMERLLIFFCVFQVENESLKRQLYDKQQLLSQASDAMNQMDEDFKDQVNNLLLDHEEKAKELEENAQQMQKVRLPAC